MLLCNNGLLNLQKIYTYSQKKSEQLFDPSKAHQNKNSSGITIYLLDTNHSFKHSNLNPNNKNLVFISLSKARVSNFGPTDFTSRVSFFIKPP